jgi:hypothetical protein
MMPISPSRRMARVMAVSRCGSGKPAWLMVYGAPGAVVEVQIIA